VQQCARRQQLIISLRFSIADISRHAIFRFIIFDLRPLSLHFDAILIVSDAI